MQVKVDWQDNVHFVANNNSGHTVAMDGPPEQGGQDRGSRPMELMLMGLGGCTAFDVVDILRKGRQQVEGLSPRSHGTASVSMSLLTRRGQNSQQVLL